ncbi:MAG: hypothetical protein QXN17_03835 [Nitrososphaerota archaeon]
MEKLLKVLENPDEVLKVPLRLIEDLDSIIKKLDNALNEFDNKIIYKSIYEQRETGVFSPSYPGQSKEDACAECLERHYAKAHGLLEEAERFSLKYGKITPEAREKIRRAIEEIVTAEDDLGTNVKDEEFKKALDEIKVLQRDIRKFMWAKGLTTVSNSIDDLRIAKDMVKRLLDKAYEMAEKYRIKYGECPACNVDPNKFFKILCDRIGDKCFEALQKYLKNEISNEEFIRVLIEEGKSKGITDEDIEKMIKMATK